MSLGSTYNNNQGNGNKYTVADTTTYSDYRMNNAESTIDPSCLAPRFWKQSLCLSIYPRKNTGNDEVAFDTDNGVTIYLSHTKARMLANELRKFIENPVDNNSCGVHSGSAVVTISNGVEFGKNTPVLTIRKLDENGNVVSAFSYEFKQNYFSIKNYDGRNYNSDYESYKNIEIEQLITLLEEFVKASTKAVAASVHSSAFTLGRMDNKINEIAAQLGVETNSSSSSRKFGNSSYFDKMARSNGNVSGGSYSPGSVSYGTATIDDIE